MISINPNTPTAKLIEQTQQFVRNHPWLFVKVPSLAPPLETPLMRFAHPIGKTLDKESK